MLFSKWKGYFKSWKREVDQGEKSFCNGCTTHRRQSTQDGWGTTTN